MLRFRRYASFQLSNTHSFFHKMKGPAKWQVHSRMSVRQQDSHSLEAKTIAKFKEKHIYANAVCLALIYKSMSSTI